jgi:hypothetical protein
LGAKAIAPRVIADTTSKMSQESYDEAVNIRIGRQEDAQKLSAHVREQETKLAKATSSPTRQKPNCGGCNRIVSEDQSLVKAILMEQHQLAVEDIWNERLIGFFSGVLASLSAAGIIGLFRRYRQQS